MAGYPGYNSLYKEEQETTKYAILDEFAVQILPWMLGDAAFEMFALHGRCI